jgi:hypothetical protein
MDPGMRGSEFTKLSDDERKAVWKRQRVVNKESEAVGKYLKKYQPALYANILEEVRKWRERQNEPNT